MVILRQRWVCLVVEVGFKLLSVRGKMEAHMNLVRKSIKNKAITKLINRVLGRWMKLWCNKEMSNILSAPSTLRTTIRRKIWSKILRETSVKKLVNKCDCFAH